MWEKIKSFGRSNKEEEPKRSQLEQVMYDLHGSSAVLDIVARQIFEQSKGFESIDEVKDLFGNIKKPSDALRVGRLIDSVLGEGSLRKISFLSKSADAERNIKRILEKEIRGKSFEHMAEK